MSGILALMLGQCNIAGLKSGMCKFVALWQNAGAYAERKVSSKRG
jgi:hypothetical protein